MREKTEFCLKSVTLPSCGQVPLHVVLGGLYLTKGVYCMYACVRERDCNIIRAAVKKMVLYL